MPSGLFFSGSDPAVAELFGAVSAVAGLAVTVGKGDWVGWPARSGGATRAGDSGRIGADAGLCTISLWGLSLFAIVCLGLPRESPVSTVSTSDAAVSRESSGDVFLDLRLLMVANVQQGLKRNLLQAL